MIRGWMVGLGLVVGCGADDAPARRPVVEVEGLLTCEDVTCSGATPFCEDAACVACPTPGPDERCAELDPSRAVCDDTGACVACTEHEHCGSGVCDRDASICIDEAAIVYVANAGFLDDRVPGEDTSGCGARDRPCLTLHHAVGTRLDPDMGRAWVHVADGRYTVDPIVVEHPTFVVGGPDVEIYGDLNATDPLFEVTPGGELRLDRLWVNGSRRIVQCRGADRNPGVVRVTRSILRGAAAVGISVERCSLTLTEATVERCDAVQVSARNAEVVIEDAAIGPSNGEGLDIEHGSLVLERSLVEGNREGGVHTDETDFVIRNNLIQDNGRSGVAGSTIGGVMIERDGPEVRTFEFNTVVANRVGSYSPYAPGVDCNTFAYIDIRNSLLWANSQTDDPDRQVGGLCRVAYSDVEYGLIDDDRLEEGPGNLDQDPAFVDDRRGDFRILPESPLVDAADPDATVTDDVDGNPRPSGAGFDIGAYEVPR